MSGFHTGVVKHWNEDRGFGFVTVDAIGADVYVHRTQLMDGVALAKDAVVTMTVEEEKGKLVGKSCSGANGEKGQSKGCGGYGAPSGAGAKGGLNADYAMGKDKGGKDGWGKGKDNWGGDGKGKDSWGKDGKGKDGGWDQWGKEGGKGKGWDDGWGKGKGWDDGWGGKGGKGGYDDGWGGKGGDGWGKDSWGKGKDSWGKDGKGNDSWGKGGKGGKGGADVTGNGWVKSWNEDRGFGFVGMDSGVDVYVHRVALMDGQALVVDTQVYVTAGWNAEKSNYQAHTCYGAAGKGGQKGGGKVKAGTEAPLLEGMQNGKVKAWHQKGFGFLIPDLGGADVFVHQNALVDTTGLEVGASVSFDLQWDQGKGKYLALSCLVTAPPAPNTGPVVVAPPKALENRSSPYGGEMEQV